MNFSVTKSGIFLILILAFTCRLHATNVKAIVEENTGGRPRIGQAEVCLIASDGSVGKQDTNNNGVTIFNNVPVGGVTVRTFKSGFIQKIITTSLKAVAEEVVTLTLNPGSATPVTCQVHGPNDVSILLDQTSANPVPKGSTVGYNLIFRNNGSATLTNVLGRITFPQGFKSPLAASTPPGMSCSTSGLDTVNCTISSFQPGAKVAAGIKVNAPTNIASGPADFPVTAQVDPNNTVPEGNEANNSDNVTTTVIANKPDLTRDLSGSDTTVLLGHEYAYQVKVLNIGSGEASPVKARITLPPEANFVRTENSDFNSCTRQDQVITCQAFGISPGLEKSVRIIARPKSTTPGGRHMLMSVNVDPDNEEAESSETNNVSFVQTITEVPPLDLSISVGSVTSWSCTFRTQFIDELHIGFAIRVNVNNDGETSTIGTRVRVILPNDLLNTDRLCPSAGTRCDPSTLCQCVPGESCELTSNGAIYEIGSIPASGSRAFTFNVEERNVLSSNYQVTFRADEGNVVEETNESNNETQVTVD